MKIETPEEALAREEAKLPPPSDLTDAPDDEEAI